MTRWKHALAWVGFGLAALAVATDRPIITWAAISFLGLALILRLLVRIRARRSASERDSLSVSRDE
jgi:membrane protein implicated in regulation of membrane protease activity